MLRINFWLYTQCHLWWSSGTFGGASCQAACNPFQVDCLWGKHPTRCIIFPNCLTKGFANLGFSFYVLCLLKFHRCCFGLQRFGAWSGFPRTKVLCKSVLHWIEWIPALSCESMGLNLGLKVYSTGKSHRKWRRPWELCGGLRRAYVFLNSWYVWKFSQIKIKKKHQNFHENFDSVKT